MISDSVPFPGWSVAAQNFRRRAREHAATPGSVLFIGEHGVGKRAMANVWRYVSGLSEEDLPIIDLDTAPTRPPGRCLALTTRPLAPGAGRASGPATRSLSSPNDPILLDTDRPGRIPQTECQNAPLPPDLANTFAIKLYMPPLRRRAIDTLSFLHQYSQARTGKIHGGISSRLIYRLVLNASRNGNLDRLRDYLCGVEVLLEEQGPDEADPSGFDRVLNWHLPDDERGVLGSSRDAADRLLLPDQTAADDESPDWDCDDVRVPTGHLPLVALSMLIQGFWDTFHRSQHAIRAEPSADNADGHEQKLEVNLLERPLPVLGPLPWWTDASRWQGVEKRIEKASPEEALVAGTAWGRPDEPVIREAIPGFARSTAYGGSLASLQDGLGVRLMPGTRRLFDWLGAISKVTDPAVAEPTKLGRPPSLEPSDKELEAFELVQNQGLKLEEAAARMGCKKQNVSKLLQSLEKKIQAKVGGRTRTRGRKESYKDNTDSYAAWVQSECDEDTDDDRDD
jgi:predicted DNA-binding protein (UPF0251 family)